MPKYIVLALVPLVTSIFTLGSVQAQEEQQVQASKEEVAQIQAELSALRSQVITTGLLAAVSQFESAEFHAMDEALNEGELNPRYLDTVRNTILVAKAVEWPEELQGEATDFIEAAAKLETALADENVESAAEEASEVHDNQHVLSHAVFAYLAGEGDHHGGHAESTEATSSEIPQDAMSFDLQISEQGGVVGGASTFKVKRGDTVAFNLESAASGSLHLHGHDLEWDLTGGEEVVVSFTADSTGRFPLEVHPSGEEQGVVVGYLEVHP